MIHSFLASMQVDGKCGDKGRTRKRNGEQRGPKVRGRGSHEASVKGDDYVDRAWSAGRPGSRCGEQGGGGTATSGDCEHNREALRGGGTATRAGRRFAARAASREQLQQVERSDTKLGRDNCRKSERRKSEGATLSASPGKLWTTQGRKKEGTPGRSGELMSKMRQGAGTMSTGVAEIFPRNFSKFLKETDKIQARSKLPPKDQQRLFSW